MVQGLEQHGILDWVHWAKWLKDGNDQPLQLPPLVQIPSATGSNCGAVSPALDASAQISMKKNIQTTIKSAIQNNFLSFNILQAHT